MDREDVYAALVELVDDADDRVDGRRMRLDDTPFTEYGLDSLARIRLAALVEDRFAIVITDSDAHAATSMQRLVDLIVRKVATR
jgi:acyl carrier protein